MYGPDPAFAFHRTTAKQTGLQLRQRDMHGLRQYAPDEFWGPAWLRPARPTANSSGSGNCGDEPQSVRIIFFLGMPAASRGPQMPVPLFLDNRLWWKPLDG